MSTLELMLAYKLNGDIDAYGKLLEVFVEPTLTLVRERYHGGNPRDVYSQAFKIVQDAIDSYNVRAIAPVGEYMKEFVERSLSTYFDSNTDSKVEEEKQEFTSEEVKLFEAVDEWGKTYITVTGANSVPLQLLKSVFQLSDEQVSRMSAYFESKCEDEEKSGIPVEFLRMLFS